MRIYGKRIQNPTKPKTSVIILIKKAKGVLPENKVTKAKRMKQSPPIVDIVFLLIQYFSFIYYLIIN